MVSKLWKQGGGDDRDKCALFVLCMRALPYA